MDPPRLKAEAEKHIPHPLDVGLQPAYQPTTPENPAAHTNPKTRGELLSNKASDSILGVMQTCNS